MIRLHVESGLARGQALALPDAQGRYLVQVMRRGPGDEVLVFNGRDGEWLARLTAADRREVRLTLERRTRVQPPAGGPVLILALVKRAPLETAVAKAVELGVATIRLITTDRTNADHTRIDRLEVIAIEAAEQTGRLDVPRIHPPEPLSGALDAHAVNGPVVYCDESGDAPPLLAALRDIPSGTPAVLIGPEGGFSPSERTELKARIGVIPVSLGPRILRADTAALAALAVMQAAIGDWRD